MLIVTILRDSRDGFTRTLSSEVPDWTEREAVVYLWTDGNWGCDCNRSRFLYEDDDDPRHLSCSDDNIIELVNLTFEKEVRT
jgi:hypothetical protein